MAEVIREETPRTVIVDRADTDDVAPRRSNTGLVIVGIILVVLLLLWLAGGSLFGRGGGGSGTNVNVQAPTPSTGTGQ